MLNGILRQERLRPSLYARLERWPNEIVEQEGAVHKRRETCDLQPLECLPAKTERHDPDEQCAAGIDCGARCRRHGARDGKTEEVEATVVR
jgi:hypothetical protein